MLFDLLILLSLAVSAALVGTVIGYGILLFAEKKGWLDEYDD